jgi:hypothetical protein
MEKNRRFTILTFPQFFDGSDLKVNVVFIPRNQDPLKPAIEGEQPAIPDAPAFADAKLSFVAKVIQGLSGFPNEVSSVPPISLSIGQPTTSRPLFEALANQFKIKNKGIQNTNFNINNFPERAPAPVTRELSVKKYLPLSYRKSFNFVAPKTQNAVTDDSYHCAVRESKVQVGFTQSPEEISWGEVYAYAMRQPLLAQALGIIYKTQLHIENSYFPKGGWLYIDLADNSEYKTQQTKDNTFIKRYAARIPPLRLHDKRFVFASVQFPVSSTTPSGNYDDIFIEAANYDDGFAKIVHAFQPVSNNLLLEESDSFHPIKEVGIRLGWDDEQILIWYMRQLMEDETVGPKQRIDAPIGVFGYRIDVREKKDPPGPWQSLNSVISKNILKVTDPTTNNSISIGKFEKEFNYQVYPSRIDGDPDKNYWLPMYFANWNGKSMVLPDNDAAFIYQNENALANIPTNVTEARPDNLNKIYESHGISTSLRYGKYYEFRVRLSDLSGGGPEADKEPITKTPSQICVCHFRRFVAPDTIRIEENLPVNADEQYFEGSKLTIKRPLLGYPAVIFTGRYIDVVTLLRNASVKLAGHGGFGIADPDVQSVHIVVEMQTLKMDNLMSISGKEPYIQLYTTSRKFPKISSVFEDELIIPLEYIDCKVLNFGDPGDLGDLGVNQTDINNMEKLVLPTARTIRLTIRAVCEEKDNYYGLEKADPDSNTRYGRIIQVLLYKESSDERNLFSESSSIAKKIQGIYLQPDKPIVHDGRITTILLGKEVEKPPDSVQLLAQRLGLENNGLTLGGKRGQRVQFGCSNRIRHTLSPDNSTITFATKSDLINHWLCCITLQLERDWTWTALKDRSIVFQRKKRFRQDDILTETEQEEIGDIEFKKTAPFSALSEPERRRTTVVFIDAVEPKNERSQPNSEDPRFPDLIELEYKVQAKFKDKHAAQNDPDPVLLLELPITTKPAQVPKIVSAGLALSPYLHNEKYSSTEPRRRFLWVEFSEPLKDPKDSYFARALAYSPDQLISNNHPELLMVPEEPALPVDPELVRVIIPNQPNDDSGLGAMEPMERSIDSDRHYLVPLPAGLHPESAEMFGFFAYEFRVGHYRYIDTNSNHKKDDHVWTTAQGRFGRELRVTGVQHPAPILICTANRDEEKLYVSAPYAISVHKGKNVTSDPPRTELWCLLYAQVRQADNKDFRNILLDDKILDCNIRVEHNKGVDWNVIYTSAQRTALKRAGIRNWKDEIDYGKFRHVYKLADMTSINKDATKYGTVIWGNSEINQLLTLYGLPLDLPLSVLCVEILPHITNLCAHINDIDQQEIAIDLRKVFRGEGFPSDDKISEKMQAKKKINMRSVNLDDVRPLNDELGHYRILRTSALTEVPFVCCTECG